MYNKILIALFFTSSSVYCIDYNLELIKAAFFGNIEDMANALKNGANVNFMPSENDVNFKAAYRGTPLQNAITLGQKIDAVSFLLKNGANVNTKDMYGKTPLNNAIDGNKATIVKLLLSNPGVIVDVSDLELAKQNYLWHKKNVDFYSRKVNELDKDNPELKKFKESLDSSEESMDKSKEIGRMLINHLGMYTGQKRISKQGITGVHGLPTELAGYIAAFSHN